MSYINASMFLDASDKVQKELMEWWQPSIGDLFSNAPPKQFYVSKPKKESPIDLNTVHCVLSNSKRVIIKLMRDCIPLLQQHQLTQFIHEKGYYLEIDNFNTSFSICIYKNLGATKPLHEVKTIDVTIGLWNMTEFIIDNEV